MALLELRAIRLAYGGPELLAGVDLRLEPGERVCLCGRNGSGKTSLLSVAAGLQSPDAGERLLARGVRIGLLPQDVPAGLTGPVREVVAGGDAPADWQTELDVDRLLAVLQLDGRADASALSAGQLRRVLLARALLGRPELLLLDEPTNHLDLPSITWLEDLLERWSGAMLFVTHDRAFLRRFARRIVELDRGRLIDWTCDYDTWLRRKEALQSAETARRREFDKRLAAEESWLRQGIKARRTRNEGRVRQLAEMRRQRAARRNPEGEVRLQVQAAERSGKLVAAVRGLRLERGGRELVRDLDLTVLRGDRLGIVGPNGAGKTSLLDVLMGRLTPTAGTVALGTNLQAAYFDQPRTTLHADRSVRWNVAEGLETLTLAGRPRHVISYLGDFLFTPERAEQPVRSLSGGERNRLLLARLFVRPANVFVLDEPTNDLDLETLELLENLLVELPSTVLVVSHDRQFLDNVVTSLLVLDGRGQARESVGGYLEWERQGAGWREQQPPRQPPPAPRTRRDVSAPQPPARRLRWQEARELEALPVRIEALEREQAALHGQLADPALYRGGKDQVTALSARLTAVAAELASAYARWEELEGLAGSS
ncbi:MAG: ATP-binding cassette domain-containing protein [Candidatus Krumholzibacteria bacterium]|nr:ATP-binding cassette domain-containing protein [Candidatus Krumholzibacteria bacterium]